MSHRTSPLVTTLFVVAALLTAMIDRADAATLTVTKTADTADGTCNSDCSLREAVRDANDEAERPGPDVITFAADGVYALDRGGSDDNASAGDLDITTDITIVGSGIAGTTILQTRTNERVFEVTNTGRLRLANATVTGGTPAGSGGGVLSQSALHLSNVRLIDNDPTAGGGGAVAVTAGSAEIVDSLMSGNSSAGADGGGALFVDNNASVTLTRVQVVGNTSSTGAGGIKTDVSSVLRITDSAIERNVSGSAGGGGIWAQGSFLSITRSRLAANDGPVGGGALYLEGAIDTVIRDSTIEQNEASGTGGAGILNRSSESTSIARTSISANDSTGNGGGIANIGAGTTSISATTISGNDGDGNGGGIYATAGTVSLVHTTLVGNSAGSGGATLNGGGIRTATTLTVKASIIANNIDFNGPDPTTASDCSGTLTTLGRNVFGVGGGCAATGPGDTVANPALGPLAFNGGPTQTHRISSSSPARNRVPDADPVCAGVDQRGAPKPYGPACDSGAYELTYCRSAIVNVVGTGRADRLVGTTNSDGIIGLGGGDTIRGGGGNDRICGGDGNDRLFGDDGLDQLDGGAHTDRCVGGLRNDAFFACETAAQ